ncbi:MAG: hypothetical protein IPI58_07425 [Alphaproteobacteria bacterium]|nr:MAG: hypothetical protein IPI58_07425 [Alphaproteobacteria bacterium]
MAILAVLASAIAAASGSFNGDISTISAKAQAAAILEQANEVKLGVDRLIAKGCTDTQISFENPIVSGYVNSNAPSDKSCHVFDINGGGIIYKDISRDATDKNFTSESEYARVIFSGNERVMQVGTYLGEELMMFYPYIKLDVCLELNKILNVKTSNDSPPVLNAYDVSISKYDGYYSYNAVFGFGVGQAPEMIGMMSGCWNQMTNPISIGLKPNSYHFYQVLVVR